MRDGISGSAVTVVVMAAVNDEQGVRRRPDPDLALSIESPAGSKECGRTAGPIKPGRLQGQSSTGRCSHMSSQMASAARASASQDEETWSVDFASDSDIPRPSCSALIASTGDAPAS